ncbi:hypothetical protein PPERSA_07772 [Pseudocohnilembus persalinus]|uniref:Uncharacterized protein n=1 Tax=Pseudocohnilembus persalinus TaxID=266149 RepID=A0A0V0R9R5_PSEPJ|nr:hypothetical protein PPERSA_07772 [Pseudocohnilembus persalinus]|eukprot:KRX11247.1 hypothetical protein PPERSA_07772 [Pseudocohnilembus persalinus]
MLTNQKYHIINDTESNLATLLDRNSQFSEPIKIKLKQAEEIRKKFVLSHGFYEDIGLNQVKEMIDIIKFYDGLSFPNIPKLQGSWIIFSTCNYDKNVRIPYNFQGWISFK